MLEMWHLAVKLRGHDEPTVLHITSNTLEGAMGVVPLQLAYDKGLSPGELEIEGIALVGVGRDK